jgi:hypothetical protein
MEKKIYLFRSIDEIEDSQQIFYANNFLILYYRRVYFVIINEKEKTFSSKGIINRLVKIEPIDIKNNRNKYLMHSSIHNGANLIEVRFDFIKEATIEDMTRDGILQDLVAIRLKGEIN